ncbi:MAG: hypothetical protein P8174_01530 [Gemmatimonadota bacterium]|jgi:hypothetical protein
MTHERRDGENAGDGPVPVRASMSPDSPATDAPVEPPSSAESRSVKRFRHGDEEWLARIAGESAYGTGGRGLAYLVAVHFLRAADAGTPLKETLIPAARFHGLAEPELQKLLDEAVPIDLDREPTASGRHARRSLGGRPGGRSSGRQS